MREYWKGGGGLGQKKNYGNPQNTDKKEGGLPQNGGTGEDKISGSRINAL